MFKMQEFICLYSLCLWHRVFVLSTQEAKMWINLKKYSGGVDLETRISLIGIIVEDLEAVSKLNSILHDYGDYIIGRMGLPYREKKINIISIVVNAEANVISTLAGKLGMIKGINVKTIYSKK